MHIVQAIDLVEGETLHQPVVEHGERALSPLLGRLEDETDGAVEAAFIGEQPRGTQEHAGVAIMAAGMHQARRARAIGMIALLGDPQCVHVSAQRDGAVAGAAPQRSNDAGTADAFHHLIEAELPEPLRHEGRGALFLEAEFGMGVQIVPPCFHVTFERVQAWHRCPQS